ncbi:MAG: sel1 repeat family protein, partial [Holosporales bacterium]|nr:sel1 repeat family protein [Holosporales bacterium]
MTVMSIKTFCSSVLYLALPCFFTGFGIDTCLGNDVRWSDLVDEGATDGEDVYTTSIDGGDVFVFDVFPIGGEDAFIFDVVPLSGLIKEYKRLADQGDAVYQFEYGSALMRGVSVRRNLNKAAAYFKLSADQGNMCGMLNYAFCLEHGAGVERDPSKAVRIYANLNKRGDLSGKYNYARCLERGIGIRVNKSLAIKYYSCLADLSEFEENSCTRLLQGIMIYKHPLEAVSYYKFLADLGHASAQYNYAFCLEKGKGVEKDLAEAARYFGLSANQGFCRAQAKYGFYLKSAGYICEAAEYFRLAAAQNDKYGLYDYARCLEYGSGVSMD